MSLSAKVPSVVWLPWSVLYMMKKLQATCNAGICDKRTKLVKLGTICKLKYPISAQ